MKKTMFAAWIVVVMFVPGIPAIAQMGGGMMGGQQGTMMGPQSSPGQADSAGAGIFSQNCAGCHPNGGNVIVPNLPINGSRVLGNFKTFEAFIRSPKMPDGSQGAMPAFPASKISNKQAKELYDFVKSNQGYGGGAYGYGMGPGMMGGYGMGPGMMGGYGMGPGMMGGYGMGPGSYGQSAECQKFYEETVPLRKELNDKRFEYFEAVRNPKTTMEKTENLQKEIEELRKQIYSKAPLNCWW